MISTKFFLKALNISSRIIELLFDYCYMQLQPLAKSSHGLRALIRLKNLCWTMQPPKIITPSTACFSSSWLRGDPNRMPFTYQLWWSILQPPPPPPPGCLGGFLSYTSSCILRRSQTSLLSLNFSCHLQTTTIHYISICIALKIT